MGTIRTAKITNAKTKLQGIPSRARQRIPHLTTTDVAELEDLIREVLEDIASDTGSP